MASSTNESQLFSESAEDQRERKLQRRRERERARRASESAEQREAEDWQRGESETGPDELLKQQNKGKHICKVDAIG